MEEKHATLETEGIEQNGFSTNHSGNDNGWQEVTYKRRQNEPTINNNTTTSDDVNVPQRGKLWSDYTDDEGEGEGETVAEAAMKIDASDLQASLNDTLSAHGREQDDILLMKKFAYYFEHAFFAVTSSQFPWVELLKEKTVAEMADIPLIHIPESVPDKRKNIPKSVRKISIEFINERSLEALSFFVLWALDSILADLPGEQAVVEDSENAVQHTSSSESQVAMFAVLAMVLQHKPDALISQLSKLTDDSKYQVHDKLPLIVWMICQASIGDLCVGLYAWAHILLPLVSGTSVNPQSSDLVLQLAEKILSAPEATTTLVNGAIRKGEPLITPSALDTFMRVIFSSSAREKDTDERFDSIYPNLKELAFPDFNANPNKIVAGETDDVNVPQRKELWSDSTDDHETSEDDDARKVEEVEKKKKKGKAKVTMNEKIDASDMGAFPAETSAPYDEKEQEIVMMQSSYYTDNDHGWQEVTCKRRKNKLTPSNNSDSSTNSNKITKAQKAANADDVNVPPKNKLWTDYIDDCKQDEDGDVVNNGEDEEVKKKKKKKKNKKEKAKVTVAEATEKIDASDKPKASHDEEQEEEEEQEQWMKPLKYLASLLFRWLSLGWVWIINFLFST